MTVVQSAKRKGSRSLPYQPPAGGNSGAEGGANENVVIQIPDRCLTHAGVVNSPASRFRQDRRRLTTPATGRSRPKSARDHCTIFEHENSNDLVSHAMLEK
jgi:hypothetical protein